MMNFKVVEIVMSIAYILYKVPGFAVVSFEVC